jgi:glycosyltransferase involved in cell wall biosynthesis
MAQQNDGAGNRRRVSVAQETDLLTEAPAKGVIGGKRIAIVGNFGRPGGGAVFARAAMLGRCLQRGGARVQIVSDAPPVDPARRTETLEGMDVCLVGGQFLRDAESLQRIRRRLGGQSGLVRWLQAIPDSERPGVVLLSGVGGVTCIRIAKIARAWGIPCAADICDWFPAVLPGSTRELVSVLDNEITQRVLYSRLNGLVVVSRFLENYYLRRSPAVHRLPILIDRSDTRLGIPARLGSPEGELRLVYAGTPGRGKDRLVELVVAVTRANAEGLRVTLTVVGLEPVEWARVGRAVQPRASIDSEYFVPVGRVEASQVPVILARNDFSVLVRVVSANSLAGFPSKVVESCACATPVVMCPVGDIANLLVDGDSAVFLGGWRVEDILRGLRRAAALAPEAKRHMGERSRAAVFPALSVDRHGPALCQFIENLGSASIGRGRS